MLAGYRAKRHRSTQLGAKRLGVERLEPRAAPGLLLPWWGSLAAGHSNADGLPGAFARAELQASHAPREIASGEVVADAGALSDAGRVPLAPPVPEAVQDTVPEAHRVLRVESAREAAWSLLAQPNFARQVTSELATGLSSGSRSTGGASGTFASSPPPRAVATQFGSAGGGSKSGAMPEAMGNGTVTALLGEPAVAPELAPDVASSNQQAAGLLLVDATGEAITVVDHANTIVVAAATWCPACAALKAEINSAEGTAALEGLRLVFAFGDEGGDGPGGVRHGEFLNDLPGEVALLTDASPRPTAYPSAFNPLTGEFDLPADEALRAWVVTNGQEQTAANDDTATVDPPAAIRSDGGVFGDYNGDLQVDLADYTVWRDTLGAVGDGLAADGTEDGVVDADDYAFWRENFGRDRYDFAIWQPEGVVTTNTPTVEWEPSLDAVSYDLAIATDAAGVNVVYTAADLTGTSHTVETALESGTYYALVSANNPSVTPALLPAMNNGLEFTVDAPVAMEHLVFITSASYSIDEFAEPTPFGNTFGGLESADYQCTSRAIAAGLTTGQPSDRTYKAIISTSSVHARDRFTIEGRLVNFYGEVLANDAADFWDGTIATSIAYDENGFSVANNTAFWTGTTDQGFFSGDNCQDWTQSAASVASIGLSQATNGWINQLQLTCSSSYRLVCLSPAQPQ